jgi:hypothetical protein
MKIKKTWRIAKEHITDGDIEWLKNSGLTFKVIPAETMDFLTPYGVVGTVMNTPPRLNIVTESDEQEVVFLLMYGGESFFLEQEEQYFQSY